MLKQNTPLIGDESLLPQRIQALFALYELTLHPNKSFKDDNRYNGELKLILRDYSSTTDTNISTALAEHLLLRLDYRLQHPKKAVFSTNLFEPALRLLADSNKFDSFTNNDTYAKLIAYACLRTAVHGPITGESSRQQALRVLTKWRSEPVDPRHIASLENAVNFIYGPATWSLCREDVMRDEQLPAHLWSLGLKPCVAVEKPVLQTLPDNITV